MPRIAFMIKFMIKILRTWRANCHLTENRNPDDNDNHEEEAEDNDDDNDNPCFEAVVIAVVA
jgi:hypothetical protein